MTSHFLRTTSMRPTSNLSEVMQLLTHYCLLSTSVLVLLLRSIMTVESATGPPTQTYATDLHDFIERSCRVTTYSDLCYSSLCSYVGDQDLGKLTYAAIKTSLVEAVRMADYVAAVRNKTATGAVVDCLELTKEAVTQVRDSLDEMAKILRGDEAHKEDEGGDRRRRLQMSNVQTWMSAAIMDQSTCMDGFDDVVGGGRDEEEVVRNEVSRKVKLVVKFISNALALVNSFAEATR